jgi:hypothetical protein
MQHEFEIRTTISPTTFFFRRVHFLAASLRALGTRFADHEIVVSVGGIAPRENLYRALPWSTLYPIVWRWVDPAHYQAIGYRATNLDRAWHMSRAEIVMNVDADIIFLKDFSRLFDEIRASPAVCGVMAHLCPFHSPPPVVTSIGLLPDSKPGTYWRLAASSFGLPDLPMEHQYGGWSAFECSDDHRFGPAYFNGGMVIGPSDMMEELFAHYPAAEAAIESVFTSRHLPQLARTLAIYKRSLPYRVLPMRYNFPNWPSIDRAYPDELENACVLHYFCPDIVNRDECFESFDSIARFITRRDLAGSNEVLRARVAELFEVVREEETP